MDFSGRFTYMSPSMQQMLGHQWEESGRLTIADIMPPSSLGVFLKVLKAITTEAYTVQRSRPEPWNWNCSAETARPSGAS